MLNTQLFAKPDDCRPWPPKVYARVPQHSRDFDGEPPWHIKTKVTGISVLLVKANYCSGNSRSQRLPLFRF
jgi:hypothetical protein